MPSIFVNHFSHFKFTNKTFASSTLKTVPLICSIQFDSTSSVAFTIAGQGRKRATSGVVGTKRLSLTGNQ